MKYWKKNNKYGGIILTAICQIYDRANVLKPAWDWNTNMSMNRTKQKTQT